MELIDVLTEDGQPTGEVQSRQTIHQKGSWHAAVDIFLVNHQNQVLLQKRSLIKDSFPGLWEISCSGHVDRGETPQQAAIREIQEELGLSITPEQLQKIAVVNESNILKNGTYINNEIRSIYIIKLQDPPIIYEPQEISDIKWVSLDQLHELYQTNHPDMVPHPVVYPAFFKHLQHG